MTKRLSIMNKSMITRAAITMMMVAISVCTTAQTFQHSVGLMRSAMTTINGHQMQDAHEYRQVIYLAPGQQITLHRPDNATYTKYNRWYDYQTDAAAGAALTLPAGANYTTAAGSFYIDNGNELAATYTMPADGQVHYIACDQSIYTDYTASSSLIKEPTLSQRLVFEIRPASQMATLMNAATGDQWLEEHNMIAPVGNTLLVGPDHEFISGHYYPNYFYNNGGNLVNMNSWGTANTTTNTGTATETSRGAQSAESTIYVCIKKYGNNKVGDTRTNEPSSNNRANWEKKVSTSQTVYYKRTDKTTVKASAGYVYSENGVAKNNPSVFSGRYIEMSSAAAGLKTYTLQYSTAGSTTTTKIEYTYSEDVTTSKVYQYKNNKWTYVREETSTSNKSAEQAGTPVIETTSSTGKTFNVARFNITYEDKNIIGPKENLAEDGRLDGAVKVTEQRFNFEGSGYNHSGTTFFCTPLASAESSYGFVMPGLAHMRPEDGTKGNPYWGEYAFVKRTGFVSWGSSDISNHTLAGDESTDGYLMYVDGSATPGELVNLRFNADLCPGSKMYFSAFVCNVGGSTAPNLDFVVRGVDESGVSHDLTTYTSGEFGNQGKWLRILFPFEFGSNIDYEYYTLKITNKGRNASGNDFVIDDIQIFTQKPPVVPIQASTHGCANDDGVMNTAAYLRIDYQAIEGGAGQYLYQWRDHNNAPLTDITYLNHSTTWDGYIYGYVDIKRDDQITAADTCASLFSFDQQYSQTTVPVARYVKETIGGEERYVLYIAQPVSLRANYLYTGYLATYVGELGSREGCGTYADLLISGGTTINLNGQALTNGEPEVVCGGQNNELDIVYKFVAQDTQTGELTPVTIDCKADWLFGTADYIDNHTDIYGGDFTAISQAIDARQAGTATADQQKLLRTLEQIGLLTSNSKGVSIELMGAQRSVSYIAFPIAGSAGSYTICTAPSTLTLTLPDEMNAVVIGVRGEDSNLPEFVKLNPRRIRVGEKTKDTGSLTFGIYLTSTESGRSYTSDHAVLTETTYTGSATLPTSISVTPMSNGAAASTIDEETDGIQLSGIEDLVAGYDYTFRLVKTLHDGSVSDDCNESDTYFRLRIVPAEVTWQPTGSNTAWNNDANWSSFAPLSETNVILLADRDYTIGDAVEISVDKEQSSIYTEFEEGAQAYISYDINYEPSTCANLYLPVGAALVGQEKLQIQEQVFFDLATVGDQWTMCSFPIKGVVSGDLFSPVNESTEPFEVAAISQTTDLVASDRTTYQYYISLFNQNVHVTGKSSTVQSTTWSTASNALDTRYAEGQGISIGADFATDQIIRLPKQDNTYKYYQGGAWVDNRKTAISRDADYGKPVYPFGADSKDFTINNNANGTIYLFGNPTLGYLDMNKLIAGNSGVLANSYAVYGADASKRSAIVQVSGGISTDGLDHHLLAPGRAVLLTAKASGKSLTLTITPEMIVTSDGEHGKSSAPRRRMMQSAEDKSIYISARYGEGFLSYAVLSEDADAQDEVLDDEDAEVLLLDKSKTRMAIFTTADSKSLAINRIQSATVVPLCLYAQKSCAQETVTFRGDENYLGEWDLVSLTDGSRTQLYDSLSLTLSMPQDGTCAYTLEHTRMGAPSIVTATDDIADEIHCYGTHGQLLVYSNTMLGDICIYDASGRLVADAQGAAETASFTLPCGIYVVRAQGLVVKTTVR